METPYDPSSTVTPEDLAGDRVLPGSELFGLVWINPERMSGTPCFFGTRVPVKTLFDYIRGGHPLEDFFLDFPGVSRTQVEGVLRLASDSLLGNAA